MIHKFRPVIFGLIFALFLALGVQMGQQWSLAASPPVKEYPVVAVPQPEQQSTTSDFQNPGITITIPAPDYEAAQPQQHSSMIITVDDQKDGGARLVSIWYSVIYPNAESITLMPVYPSVNPKHQGRDQQLAAIFQLTEDGDLDPNFLGEISDLGILWKGDYVLVHENAIVEIAAWVTGSNQDFEFNNIQALTTWEKDPGTAIQSQATLLGELCSATSLVIGADKMIDFISALAPHLETNISAERIRADWQQLASFGNQLNCEFPTLTP